MNADDQLVADYLSKLSEAAGDLPADRRDELIEEISMHIAEARAVLAAVARTAVADMLAALGRPEDIVRAAADDFDTEPVTFAPGQPAGSPLAGPELGGNRPAAPARPAQAAAARPAQKWRAADIGTVVLLLIGGVLIGLGWIVGVVMLWVSPRWRTSDKLLGTLVWPGGLAAVLAVPRFETGLPPLLVLSLLLVGVGGPILAAIRLLRQARRAPA